jgi:hypothetical protein
MPPFNRLAVDLQTFTVEISFTRFTDMYRFLRWLHSINNYVVSLQRDAAQLRALVAKLAPVRSSTTTGSTVDGVPSVAPLVPEIVP